MYHATLGIPTTLRILAEAGCVCCHLEYDQYPEAHVYIVAQQLGKDSPTTADRVRLRSVEAGDLSRMFDLQLDPESNRRWKNRWPVEQGYQQMTEELGLDHFEGRSRRGAATTRLW